MRALTAITLIAVLLAACGTSADRDRHHNPYIVDDVTTLNRLDQQITRLALRDSEATSDDLAPLKALQNLVEVDLLACVKLDDDVFKVLSTLPRLRLLGLDEQSAITNDAADAFRKEALLRQPEFELVWATH